MQFEVVNAGVVGYTSFQGVRLLETRILAEAVARVMAQDGLLSAAPGWEERFREGVSRYTASLVVPREEQVKTRMLLLFYYREGSPNADRAAYFQKEIERLDPEQDVADAGFRTRYFRPETSGP